MHSRAVVIAFILSACGDNFVPTPLKPDGITLSLPTVTLRVGDSLDIAASYGGTQTSAPDDIMWSSSDASKLTVDGSGGKVTVHALAVGAADLTATGEGLSATLHVSITAAQVIALVGPVQPQLAAGTTLAIHEIATYSDGTTADVTALCGLTIDDPPIATIAGGVVSGVHRGQTLLHATYDGQWASTQITVTDAQLVSIAVTPDMPNVPFGLHPQMTATGTFTDHSTQDLSSQVTWSSSLTGIATISATGQITTVAVGGPTTITAKKGTISGTTTLTVTDATVQSLAITPHTPTVPLGVKPQFTATATYSDTTTADVSDLATWTSDTPATATIDTVGKATTFAQGTTTIGATFSGASDSTLLTVGPKALATIAITPDGPDAPLGLTIPLDATGTYTDGSTGDVTSMATWSTDTPANATVDSTGLVTTHHTGTATITAAVGSISDTDLVTVDPPEITMIVVTPGSPDLAIGVDQGMTATATLTDTTTADVTGTVTWSSTDTTNAPISGGGVVSALGATTGVAITALAGNGISGTTTLATHIAPIGSYAQSTGAGLTPCIDGVKLSFAFDFAYACFTDGGFQRSAVVSDAVTFGAATTPPGNNNGLAIVAHSAVDLPMFYTSQPSATLANWWKSNDNGGTFAGTSLTDALSNQRWLYSGRYQPMVGFMLGTWDPAPAATVLIGAAASVAHVIGSATGIVRAIDGTSATNLWVAVYGQTPTGGAATGGIFQSTNSAVTWSELDTGFAAGDAALAFTVAVDHTSGSTTVYAGLQGGGRVYKSIDNGASWNASASGIPTYAKVNVVAISPADTTGQTIYAATTLGLFVSTDAGASWTSAGFLGRDVRGVARSGATGSSLLLVTVRDSLGDGTSGVYIAQ
jgi:hypothetical protein